MGARAQRVTLSHYHCQQHGHIQEDALRRNTLTTNPHGYCSLPPLAPSLPRSRQAECSRYFGDDLLRPVAYTGSPKARRRVAERLGVGLTTAAVDKHSDDDNDPDGGSSRTACDGLRGGVGGAAAEGEGEGEGGGGDLEGTNVVITSYNVLRTDARVLGEQVADVLV